MSVDKETLFSRSADGDTSYLFATQERDSLFSTDIAILNNQFTATRPVTLVPQQDNVPKSTLFGSFSDDVAPPSPVSSILSLQEEVTQHTIPDEEDIWSQANSQIHLTRKVDTWESFGAVRRDVKQEGNQFVTEQDPKVFDELLSRHMNHIYAPNESGIVVAEFLFREVMHFVGIC